MGERRPERVGHLVQAELARLFLREARDPRLRQVAVTAVHMTPDLRLARVFFRTLGDPEERPATLRALRKAAPYLRGELGRGLGLRVAPELRFEYDAAPDTARRLDELLRSAAPPRDEGEEGGGGE
jgi:ribosome-binding factor A